MEFPLKIYPIMADLFAYKSLNPVKAVENDQVSQTEAECKEV